MTVTDARSVAGLVVDVLPAAANLLRRRPDGSIQIQSERALTDCGDQAWGE